MKEISIEDHYLTSTQISVEFFEENDFKIITAPIEEFEKWVTDNNLLEWRDVKVLHDGYADQREGVWEFNLWVQERITEDILKNFVIFQMNKMKSN